MLDTNFFVKIHLQKLDDYIDYIETIIDGKIIANKHERLAVYRFLATKKIYIYKEKEVTKAPHSGSSVRLCLLILPNG
jgi:hypothetical protein